MNRFLMVAVPAMFLLAVTALSFTQQAAQGQGAAPAAQGGGRGGRGARPEVSMPTPRLPDGTVNLGRIPGEKGIWGLPYITNMGARNIVVGAPPAPPRGDAATGAQRGGGGGGGGRGGA